MTIEGGKAKAAGLVRPEGKSDTDGGRRFLRKGLYTTADIEALPEGERAELIDGEMFMMATPMLRHQDLLMWLAATIWNFIAEHRGRCKILPAPFGVYIKDDEHNFVEPDISVICDLDKLDEKGCHGAPDWVIEIVSPSSKYMDRVRKLTLYKEAGVREYWIVDPMQRNVTVYDLEHADNPKVSAFTDQVKVGIYEDFAIDFNKYLEKLQEFEVGRE
ncbi:MAG: Uma2 family endonuclease [Lachnospiraceae bacterium]|nr:Uma2 family endonuclease [Lachnospiraceae bacterium]